MAKGFSDIKPRVGSQEKARIDEQVKIFKMPAGSKWATVRFIGGTILPNALHWIDIIGSKSKEKVTIAKNCIGFDMETEDHDPKKCPYCKIGNRFSVAYYANAIIRSDQEDKPEKRTRMTADEKSTGFKEHDSEAWTPVQVIRIPSSLAQKLQGLKDLNLHKNDKGRKVGFDISDEEYGADVNIKYDAKASGTDKYQVQISDKSALTDEEKKFLIWNLTPELIPVEAYEDAKRELSRMDMIDQDGNHINSSDGDDDVDAMPSKSKNSSGKKFVPLDDDEDDDEAPPPKKGKGKPVVEDDFDIDAEEDDEDEAPPPKKGKAKPVVEDDFDIDEDEEPAPPKKGKAKPAPVVEDDFDLGDEEEAPPPPPKKGKPAPVVEDDFDLGDEEEAPPPPPKKGKAKPAPVPVVEDEADDFDLGDEEEAPPPPPKKGKAKTAPAPVPVVEDEADDFDALDEEEPAPVVKKVVRKTKK